MKINFDIKKILLSLLLIYTLFFIVCGFLAPIFAYSKQFYLADTVYMLMHKACTQQALRCFWILGYQMAICARCLGAYCGTVIGIVLWLRDFEFNKKLYLLLFVFGFGEILLEIFKVYEGNNYVRYFAGIALGGFIVVSLYYLSNDKRKGEINV